MGASYRVSQFVLALIDSPTSSDLELAQVYLTPTLFRLFKDMSRAEQAHGLRVLRTLLKEGENHPDLLAAALLHDVGKSRARLRLWERVWVTLSGPLVRSTKWPRDPGKAKGWQRPLIVANWHPEWGAEMVREAGGSDVLQRLIQCHQQGVPEGAGQGLARLLSALQAADSKN